MATIKELDERVLTLEKEIDGLRRNLPKTTLDSQLLDSQFDGTKTDQLIEDFKEDFKRLVYTLERFVTAFAGPERSFLEISSREVVQKWLDKLKREQPSPQGLWVIVKGHFREAQTSISIRDNKLLKNLVFNVQHGISFLRNKEIALNNASTADVIRQIGHDIFDDTKSRVDSISSDLAALIEELSGGKVPPPPGVIDELEKAKGELAGPKSNLFEYLNLPDTAGSNTEPQGERR